MIKVTYVFLFLCVGAILGQQSSPRTYQNGGRNQGSSSSAVQEYRRDGGYAGQGAGYFNQQGSYYGQQGRSSGQPGFGGQQAGNYNGQNFGRFGAQYYGGGYGGQYGSQQFGGQYYRGSAGQQQFGFNGQRSGSYGSAYNGQRYYSGPNNNQRDTGYQVVDPVSQQEYEEHSHLFNTHGAFHVPQHDGRSQYLHYTAGANGYRPLVSYYGNHNGHGYSAGNYGAYNGRRYGFVIDNYPHSQHGYY